MGKGREQRDRENRTAGRGGCALWQQLPMASPKTTCLSIACEEFLNVAILGSEPNLPLFLKIFFLNLR